MRREDQNHPLVSGNKWWKLKYNLVHVAAQKMKGIVTFGGAWSNHIRAVAAAADLEGFRSAGIIRGEEQAPLNSVLQFAKSHGMELTFIPRPAYRQKSSEEFLIRLADTHQGFHVLPEGGTNALAIKGCAELGQAINENEFDYLCVPVGTGGTIAGIISGMQGKRKIIGFSALKGGDFLNGEISSLLREQDEQFDNWRLETGYHFGGYAKTDLRLIAVIAMFQKEYSIPLEHVYTAKMVLGVCDMVARNMFERGSVIMLLHTGGVHDLLRP